MNKAGAVQRTRTFAIAACVVLTLVLAALAVRQYYLAQEALAALQDRQGRLAQLSESIVRTRISIDQLKKEQEEFRQYLFDERDVPAFLDGISNSAAQSSVFVIEMKTQQFREVQIPEDVARSGRAARVRVTEDLDNSSPEDPQIRLNRMLTLAAMSIDIKIQGSFEAIVNFLNSIEGYRQLLTVSNVEITSNDREYPKLSCNFTLRIYSLKNLSEIKQ